MKERLKTTKKTRWQKLCEKKLRKVFLSFFWEGRSESISTVFRFLFPIFLRTAFSLWIDSGCSGFGKDPPLAIRSSFITTLHLHTCSLQFRLPIERQKKINWLMKIYELVAAFLAMESQSFMRPFILYMWNSCFRGFNVLN